MSSYPHIEVNKDLLSKSSTGWIKMTEITAVSYTSISVVFKFHYKPQTNFTANSIRLYYTTTPGQGNADYVDITPENADSWRLSNETKNNYIVRYTLKNLPGGAGTTYYVRVWLRLFNKSGSKVKYSFKSPAEAPIACTTKKYASTVNMLMIGNPVNIVVPTIPTPSTALVYIPNNFTQLIPAGSYDVLQTDVTEEWTDANYEKHIIVARTKVTGKFNMLFSDRQEFNNFLHMLDKNKAINASGKVYMGVHLNNQLDYPEDWEEIGVGNLRNEVYWSYFYVNISSIPWVEPYYGHYDKYSPISVSIEEA